MILYSENIVREEMAYEIFLEFDIFIYLFYIRIKRIQRYDIFNDFIYQNFFANKSKIDCWLCIKEKIIQNNILCNIFQHHQNQ